jgi:glyoxylase-like metal-dependent hydrolase (beta-lactamase superfamily II)
MSTVLRLADFRDVVPGCARAVLPSPWPPGAVAVFLIESPGGRWLVDAGPDTEASTTALRGVLDRRLGAGEACAGVVLSHAHRDHSGGLASLRPKVVTAHEEAAAAVESDGRLPDGVRFETLSGDRGPLRVCEGWEWLRAGGHASGHLLLWNGEARALLAGDQFLLGLKTPLRVADPSEDSLGEYLDSLARAATLDPEVILTSHTEAIERPAAWLKRERARLDRQLERTLEAVKSGARRPQEAIARTYGTLPGEGARELLLRETLAALRHLAAAGEIHRRLRDGEEIFEL